MNDFILYSKTLKKGSKINQMISKAKNYQITFKKL